MKFWLLSTLFLSLLISPCFGQNDLPFSSIPEYENSYDAPLVSARMIDALGFRYRWATDALTEEDLAFRPAENSRSSRETVEHIYYLVTVIYNAHNNQINEGVNPADKSLEYLRESTLQMLLEVREKLVHEEPELADLKIQFPQGSFPYWYIISGPLSDALYHTGQLVMLRRISGNPVRPDVDVFLGKIRN